MKPGPKPVIMVHDCCIRQLPLRHLVNSLGKEAEGFASFRSRWPGWGTLPLYIALVLINLECEKVKKPIDQAF